MKTIEFYQKSGNIKVIFNEKHYDLEQFLTNPEGAILLNKMYLKIITDYDHLIQDKVKDKTQKGEVLGYFIKTFFLSADKSYDIVLLGENNYVKFNLEHINPESQ